MNGRAKAERSLVGQSIARQRHSTEWLSTAKAKLRIVLRGNETQCEGNDWKERRHGGMVKALLLMGYDMTWFAERLEEMKERKDADVR